MATPVELLFIHRAGEAGPACTLARRMVAHCSARSADGRLCEVETAGALWGAPGPLVTPLDHFVIHLRDRASPEQVIALTELRVVCGPADLRSQIDDAVRDLLTSQAGSGALAAQARMGIDAIAAMAVQPCGLVRCAELRASLDIAVRALQVRHAPASPDVLTPSVAAALAALARQACLDEETVRRLLDLRYRLRQVEAMLSLRFSHVPAQPDAELLRAAGMIDAAEWHAFLAEGAARLCAVRDEHLA
jgi:glutamine synthetase adenylyltransferase